MGAPERDVHPVSLAPVTENSPALIRGGLRCAAHLEREAAAECQECRRPFCAGCLVEFQGKRRCMVCKDAAFRLLLGSDLPRKNDAQDALMLSLAGVIFPGMGLALEAASLLQAVRALNAAQLEPRPDTWKAWAALGIAGVVLTGYASAGLWVIFRILR
jgi:hypothetical protein